MRRTARLWRHRLGARRRTLLDRHHDGGPGSPADPSGQPPPLNFSPPVRSLGSHCAPPGPHTGPTGAPDCDDDRPHPNGRRAPDANSTSREDQTVTVAATARRHCTDDADVALRFDALSADPALSADLAKDDGSRGGLTLGDAGVPLSLRLWPNSALRRRREPSWRTHSPRRCRPLTARPGDAVGIGAQWQVRRTLLGATTLQQTITATLRGRDADTVDLDITVDETPTGSEYTVPGTGAALHIVRYTSLGRGTVRIDLRRALPIGGSLDTRGARELVGADAARPLVQQTRYQLEWTQ